MSISPAKRLFRRLKDSFGPFLTQFFVDDLRNRLGATLRTVHGFRSEKLIELGLKPRRPRGRDRQPRVKKTKPGTEPSQPAAGQLRINGQDVTDGTNGTNVRVALLVVVMYTLRP